MNSNIVTTHERPGVYSAYEASTVVTANPRNGRAAIAAVSTGGTPNELVTIHTYADAAAAFGKEDALTKLVHILLANGAAQVLAVPVTQEGGYDDAFALLAQQEAIKVITCDSQELAVHQALQASVEEASKLKKERIAVVCGGRDDSVSQLETHAQTLNSERMVLVAPAAGEPEETPGQLAAAVAGALCAEADPALPLGGAVLHGISSLATCYTETELDTLLRAGVTPAEMVGGTCSVVRGVTTRTKTGETPDNTWRDLTTILVVDDVIPSVRSALQARFARSKNTQQVRSAIRSQVILELERKRAAEIITGYGEVTTQAREEDPTVCEVGFSFTVAHGLNQIWLRAQITI